MTRRFNRESLEFESSLDSKETVYLGQLNSINLLILHSGLVRINSVELIHELIHVKNSKTEFEFLKKMK